MIYRQYLFLTVFTGGHNSLKLGPQILCLEQQDVSTLGDVHELFFGYDIVLLACIPNYSYIHISFQLTVLDSERPFLSAEQYTSQRLRPFLDFHFIRDSVLKTLQVFSVLNSKNVPTQLIVYSTAVQSKCIGSISNRLLE